MITEKDTTIENRHDIDSLVGRMGYLTQRINDIVEQQRLLHSEIQNTLKDLQRIRYEQAGRDTC